MVITFEEITRLGESFGFDRLERLINWRLEFGNCLLLREIICAKVTVFFFFLVNGIIL